MVVSDGNFAVGCEPGTDYLQIHVFQCMLARTDDITKEVLEPITFVLAYQTVMGLFSAQNVQTGSKTNSTSYSTANRGLSARVNEPWHETNQSLPFSIEVKQECFYTATPSCLRSYIGRLFLYCI
jgi:hypothetical protein